MFKFEIGDQVFKPKGYNFIGKVVSRYTVDGGNRYDVQIDTTEAEVFVHGLRDKYGIENNEFEKLLTEYIINCDRMIHIFAEEQLEKYESIR